MAGQATGAKGNPAHKRMMNANLKNRRANSWLRGQRRKKARIEAQKQRELTNEVLRENGEPTPWERVKEKRRQRRLADPKVQKRAAKHVKL